MTGDAAFVLDLFRRGLDSLDIARKVNMTEPQVLRLLETARYEERRGKLRKTGSVG